MWCVSDIIPHGVTLVDYDTKEVRTVSSRAALKYKPLGLYWKGFEYNYIFISKYCYKVYSHISIKVLKRVPEPSELDKNKIYLVAYPMRSATKLDKHGVVWSDYNFTFNLLRLLFDIEGVNKVDITNYKGLIVYGADDKKLYHIQFDDKFRACFAKVRFNTENGLKGV